ncbi:hypothetical protein GCM10017708_00310 [Arthrobacter citreus]
MPDAAEDADFVLFELHPRAASVAKPPAGKCLLDQGSVHFDARGDALNYSYQCRPMGLTGGQPTQHGFNTAMSGPRLQRRGAPTASHITFVTDNSSRNFSPANRRTCSTAW